MSAKRSSSRTGRTASTPSPRCRLALHSPAPPVTSAMLTAVPVANMLPAKREPPSTALSLFDNDADADDSRSSSLSELGDASDDLDDEPTPHRAPADATDDDNDEEDDDDDNDDDDNDNDNDSEAETERLDDTPHRSSRTAHASDALYARTPSKLVHSKTVDNHDSVPPSPSPLTDDATMPDAATPDNPLHSLSLAAASEAANLELASKKRKRPAADGTLADSPDDDDQGPARKRSSTSKTMTLNGAADAVVESARQLDVEQQLDNAEERLSQLAHEELDLEERQADIAAQTVNELATVAKHSKPRKGGRRGKRKVDDHSFAYTEALATTETQDGEPEADNDDEDSSAVDEDVAKKKTAIDMLASIEKKFKLFREKVCDEEIAKHEQALEMLKQPNCVHPEYLAMIKCIDERRNEKIEYETTLLEYKQKNLDVITNAQRHQMHSQYFQTVRHVREDILEECNQRVFDLQRGRRTLGCDETEYMVRLPEKRSDQIRHQTAYNLEVSILSGVAKYVGFPAAPDIRPARPSEVDEDLRAMKIITRPTVPAPPPSLRTYNQRTTADEVAAEEQFLESTPWANPRHPSHLEARSQHESRFAPGQSRVPSYQTPAGQRRIVDLNAPNGSGSTIEAHSNPPSGTAYGNGRTGDSESPVLQMKRATVDYAAYSETPGPHPRAMGPSRDSYGVMSSPAPQNMDIQPQDANGQRWGLEGPFPGRMTQRRGVFGR